MKQERDSDFSVRDEANAIVAWAFRNGPIEALHAGYHSRLLEQPELSRIMDPEMKELMLFACRRVTELLELKMTDTVEYERRIQEYNRIYCGRWERD